MFNNGVSVNLFTNSQDLPKVIKSLQSLSFP